MPALEKHVLPVYPAIAVSARVQGVVQIEARVGVNGRVADARVIRSIPLLDQAALDAVRQWQFAPRAGSQTAAVTVTFALSNAPVSEDDTPAPLLGWPPRDLALYYHFDCSGLTRTLDTTKSADGSGDMKSVPTFALSAEDKERLSLLLIQEGFFSISGATTERARNQSVRVTDAGIEVTVAAQLHPTHQFTIANQVGGVSADQPRFHHELMVRTFGVWRILKWHEPGLENDEQGREAARVGAVIRQFFRSRVVTKDAGRLADCR
jgi:TonB family protein